MRSFRRILRTNEIKLNASLRTAEIMNVLIVGVIRATGLTFNDDSERDIHAECDIRLCDATYITCTGDQVQVHNSETIRHCASCQQEATRKVDLSIECSQKDWHMLDDLKSIIRSKFFSR